MPDVSDSLCELVRQALGDFREIDRQMLFEVWTEVVGTSGEASGNALLTVEEVFLAAAGIFIAAE